MGLITKKKLTIETILIIYIAHPTRYISKKSNKSLSHKFLSFVDSNDQSRIIPFIYYLFEIKDDQVIKFTSLNIY